MNDSTGGKPAQGAAEPHPINHRPAAMLLYRGEVNAELLRQGRVTMCSAEKVRADICWSYCVDAVECARRILVARSVGVWQ